MTKPDAARLGAARHVILVLEDDAPIRRIIVRVLERDGYAVLGAASPDEAIRLAASPDLPVRLLITDFSFHAVTGHEVYERLRRDRPDMRVLYISGYGEAEVLPGERRHLGAAFLQKPFAMEALVAQVRALLP